MFVSIATVALAGAALSRGPAVLVMMVVLYFLSATALSVVLMAEAGHRGSRAFAWFATASDLGAAAGPLLVWTVFEFFRAPSLAFAIGTSLYSVGVVIAVVRLMRHRVPAGEKIPEKV